MADRIIQTETLTAIGNAIRAKTGGSALITPEDMPTEIASISGGGGGSSYEMKLLYETAPTTEQVSAIKVDFTSDMLGYDFYRVALLGRFAKNPYPYVGFNTETNNRYLNAWSSTSVGSSHFECFLLKAENTYFASIGASTVAITGNPSYFHARSYSADGYFNTGFVVQIWGCNYENS